MEVNILDLSTGKNDLIIKKYNIELKEFNYKNQNINKNKIFVINNEQNKFNHVFKKDNNHNIIKGNKGY